LCEYIKLPVIPYKPEKCLPSAAAVKDCDLDGCENILGETVLFFSSELG
jgi:hypothetical protein